MNQEEVVCVCADWDELTQDMDQQWVLINIVRTFRVP
jgi:hypothetical protein